MKIVIRVDGNTAQGTGHVMRCLTLATGLADSGHDVVFFSAHCDVPWLTRVIESSGFEFRECEQDSLPIVRLRDENPEWVVVDSYLIDAEQISRLNSLVPVLAIVDGDDRGIRAALYLDQNLGAEKGSQLRDRPGETLAGAPFALVRKEILDGRSAVVARRESTHERAELLAFMGGSDPFNITIDVARLVASCRGNFRFTVIAPEKQHEELGVILGVSDDVRIMGSTPRLPELFSESDLVISAAGTSAWDLAVLGVPAIFISVVENQVQSLREIESRQFAVCFDAVTVPIMKQPRFTTDIESLLSDKDERDHLASLSQEIFDGHGVSRVVAKISERA